MNRRSHLAARKNSLFEFAQAQTHALPTLVSRSPDTLLAAAGGTVALVGTGFASLRSVKIGDVTGAVSVTDNEHASVVFGPLSLPPGLSYIYVNTGGGQAIPLPITVL